MLFLLQMENLTREAILQQLLMISGIYLSVSLLVCQSVSLSVSLSVSPFSLSFKHAYLREDGGNVTVIGVGGNVDKNELKAIAGPEGYAHIDTFDIFHELSDELLEKSRWKHLQRFYSRRKNNCQKI